MTALPPLLVATDAGLLPRADQPAVQRYGTTVVLVPGGVEAYIYGKLKEFSTRVTQAIEGVTCRLFSDAIGSLYLHCYLEISRPEWTESLTCSIAYRNNSGRFVVAGYVCGEESGRSIWDQDDREVNPDDLDTLDDTLRSAVDQLVEHSFDSICEAAR